ncbi:hypothetical protein [Leptospira alstonii]|uniref:Uncharacterized protein n=2 Tax=Leptospira alstonii TaxID=28452 RepID=M6CXT8_9LEPT|nr:hypothetical protein [Leptospira alstonii]EMJ96702.1 hypothetical protein LEP1GSC194_4302 [Leptospira alstonii serovar Sichuan str. 79601]EQA78742.1 hypothetical protein LEP1GSC193_1688 [Leptospira alstonii serovar Pingchang str. 80-412]
MLIIIFTGLSVCALVTLGYFFGERKYKINRISEYYKTPLTSQRLPNCYFYLQDVANTKNEILEKFKFSGSGDRREKLQVFLESLKFHDQVLDGIFQDTFGSADHYNISRKFCILIDEVELTIRILEKEEEMELFLVITGGTLTAFGLFYLDHVANVRANKL